MEAAETMMLTTANPQAYAFPVIASVVAGIGIPNGRAAKAAGSCNAAFSLPGVSFNGRTWRGAARLAGALPGMPTRHVPPTTIGIVEAVIQPMKRKHTMNATQVAHKAPVIAVVNGTITTTSQAVAEFFSKNHKDVLRKIEALRPGTPKAWCERNFALTSIEVEQPNGGTRQETSYNITRDGFVLLAMGFTGARALAWKIKYIEAFNKMEARLAKRRAVVAHKPAAVPALPAKVDKLTPELRHRINKKAWELAQQNYEYHRDAMLEDVLIGCGHTAPENWQPLECRHDVLELIEVLANMLWRNSRILRIRGRKLAAMVGENYDEVVAKFHPPKKCI